MVLSVCSAKADLFQPTFFSIQKNSSGYLNSSLHEVLYTVIALKYAHAELLLLLLLEKVEIG